MSEDDILTLRKLPQQFLGDSWNTEKKEKLLKHLKKLFPKESNTDFGALCTTDYYCDFWSEKYLGKRVFLSKITDRAKTLPSLPLSISLLFPNPSWWNIFLEQVVLLFCVLLIPSYKIWGIVLEKNYGVLAINTKLPNDKLIIDKHFIEAMPMFLNRIDFGEELEKNKLKITASMKNLCIDIPHHTTVKNGLSIRGSVFKVDQKIPKKNFVKIWNSLKAINNQIN